MSTFYPVRLRGLDGNLLICHRADGLFVAAANESADREPPPEHFFITHRLDHVRPGWHDQMQVIAELGMEADFQTEEVHRW